MKPIRSKAYTLMYKIRKQYPPNGGVYTCNPCSMDGCTRTTMGVGRCGNCLVKALGELVGEKIAEEYRSIQIGQNKVAEEIEKALEFSDSKH